LNDNRYLSILLNLFPQLRQPLNQPPILHLNSPHRLIQVLPHIPERLYIPLNRPRPQLQYLIIHYLVLNLYRSIQQVPLCADELVLLGLTADGLLREGHVFFGREDRDDVAAGLVQGVRVRVGHWGWGC